MADNTLLKLDEYIKSIVNEEDYVSFDVHKQRLSHNGSGYMGIQYEITIKGKTADSNKETYVFAKLKIPNAEMKIYSVSDIYSREAFAYKELSYILNDIQTEFNVPWNEQYKLVKSFKCCNSDAIILENVAKTGYKICSRMDVLNLKYAELCIVNLAKFHSLSLVLKDKYPEYFSDKMKMLQNPFIFGRDWSEFVNNMIDISMNYLDKDLRNTYEDKIKGIVYKYPEYFKDTLSIQTLCHGDYKHNNIMVLDSNGNASEVMTIDYQLLHYGCPVLDILYFIFNGTDQQFRKENLNTLKNLYYNTFRDFLKKFKLDVNNYMPREEFDKLFKEKLDFGLMINVFYVPFLFASEEDVPDVTKPLGNISFKIDPRFGKRFRGVVDDFINWGYL